MERERRLETCGEKIRDLWRERERERELEICGERIRDLWRDN